MKRRLQALCSPPHVRVGRVRVLHAVVDGIDDGASGAVERCFHGSNAFEWPAAAVEPAQSERAVGRGDSERGLGMGPGRRRRGAGAGAGARAGARARAGAGVGRGRGRLRTSRSRPPRRPTARHPGRRSCPSDTGRPCCSQAPCRPWRSGRSDCSTGPSPSRRLCSSPRSVSFEARGGVEGAAGWPWPWGAEGC